MTETTDIAARQADEFSKDQWWYKELLTASARNPGDLDLRRAVIGIIPKLIEQLEAERKRADDAEHIADYLNDIIRHNAETITELVDSRDELRARLTNPVVLPPVAPTSLDEAVKLFETMNIGFPVKRLRADYVIGWCLANIIPGTALRASECEIQYWAFPCGQPGNPDQGSTET